MPVANRGEPWAYGKGPAEMRRRAYAYVVKENGVRQRLLATDGKDVNGGGKLYMYTDTIARATQSVALHSPHIYIRYRHGHDNNVA